MPSYVPSPSLSVILAHEYAPVELLKTYIDYIKSKINICGRGHELVSVNPKIFVDEDYRCHAKNRLKFLLNLAIITNVLSCSESKSELATAEKDEFYDIIYKTKNDLYKNSKTIDCLYNNIKKQVDFLML